MSRKKSKQAVPDEVLAEGSGPVEVVAEEAKQPSKKKFSKKKAPKAKKVAAAEAAEDSEPADELRADGDDSAADADELRVDGDDAAARADGDDSATEADELAADGDDVADDDSETDADELRVDGASPDADVLRANGDDSDSDTDADELRAADVLRAGDEASADADELRVDGASPDADELGARSSDDADQLRADGDGAGDDAPVLDGDDVVGAPITDEAGVEAALLPGGLSAVQLRHLIEALIFATDKPVTLQRLRQLTRVSDVARIESALAELQEDYKDRGIALQQVSGGYQFRTNTTFSSWVQQLIAGRPVRLSRAQLETLAIVAYRQPITRPEIDQIRGVDSSNTLRLLLERSLIRVLGRREEVGRPTLYGTTKEFLDFFSLGDLRELPTLREYSELTAESRQVMSDRLGVPLDANGELEPEVSDELDPDQLEPDSTSIVDSILAEHAAAEAEAEARFDARDASAIAEAAMSGGSFGHAPDDDDAMSLSGGEMSTIGSRLPASEARSYVDAIRASVVESDAETDDVELAAFSVADELHVADASDEGSMVIGETTSAKSNLDDVSLEAHSDSDSMSVTSAMHPHVGTDESLSASDGHLGDDVSESMAAASSSMNPHVETDESMSASDEVSVSDELMSASREPHMADASDEGSMVIGETTSAKSNLDDESLEAHSDSDSMSVTSAMNPHVETSDGHLGDDVSESVAAAGETTSAKSNIDDESLEAHAGQDDSESRSMNPHVETDESMSASEAHVAHDDSESMAAGEMTSAKSNIDDAHLGHDDSEAMLTAGETMSAESNIDRDSESDSEPMTADESHDAHVGHVDSESMSAASSLDPHVETDESMSAAGTHADDDSESMAATSPDGGHDSPSTGDLMAASASDAPHAGHDASQVGHEMNSAEPDLDAEAHVGHNAPVNREPDNDPESSGN